jgi:hypothetical protein
LTLNSENVGIVRLATKFKELYWKTGRSHDNLLMQLGGHFVSEKRKAIWWANQYFSAAAAVPQKRGNGGIVEAEKKSRSCR